MFVADDEPTVWPFLRDFQGDAEECQASATAARRLLAEELSALGAGSRYQIAIRSPSGLTPMVIIDPVSGNPDAVVEESCWSAS